MKPGKRRARGGGSALWAECFFIIAFHGFALSTSGRQSLVRRPGIQQRWNNRSPWSKGLGYRQFDLRRGRSGKLRIQQRDRTGYERRCGARSSKYPRLAIGTEAANTFARCP